MLGADTYTEGLFTLKKLDDFVPMNHPLRVIRTMVNQALAEMGELFARMYEDDVKGGRPSITPEKLLRAMLLQVLYSIRSERQLMEQTQYNLLFRWFIGLSMDDAIWVQYRKGKTASELRFMGHTLMENRNGLVVGAMLTQANGHAEREAAKLMICDARAANPEGEITLGADKGYDAGEFIKALQDIGVAPHVAQNKAGRASAVPDEIASSEGYAISQQKRKRIEQGFGWGKLIGPIRQVVVRGIKKVGQVFVMTMVAYNLVRMRTLGQVRLQGAQ